MHASPASARTSRAGVPAARHPDNALLYRPHDGALADVIPFHRDGMYHLFYLKDHRDAALGEGVPWWHLSTTDFVSFSDHGEAIPRGAVGSPDQWVFTGSIIEHRGVFHAFYTGHNAHYRAVGKPTQVVLRATSPDLGTWTKDASFSLGASAHLDQHEWRDPFVFWNEEAAEFWMLLLARPADPRGRGFIALRSSADLIAWRDRGAFTDPRLHFGHECPDLFRMGEWWYLVWSEFSDRTRTVYRKARSLSGPWLHPDDDTFDGRAFYAAKTAGDGRRRFAFGWLPTRANDANDGDWQWGGSLVTHELRQTAAGDLRVHPPAEVVAAFAVPRPLEPAAITGAWRIVEGGARCASLDACSTLSLGTPGKTFLAEARMTLSADSHAAGFLLRTSPGMDGHFQVRVEPRGGRVVIDRWPKPMAKDPHVSERPVVFAPDRPIHLRVIVDGTCLVAYVDDAWALSCRMYGEPLGGFGLFVQEADAVFTGVSVRTLGEPDLAGPDRRGDGLQNA